jgi:hypothetical protein
MVARSKSIDPNWSVARLFKSEMSCRRCSLAHGLRGAIHLQ